VEEPPPSRFERSRIEAAAEKVDLGEGHLDRSPIVTMEGAGRPPGETRHVSTAKFLRDEVAPVRKRPGIREDLMEVLGSAQESLLVETPYLVVTKGMRKLFQKLIDNGVQVRLLTNSLLTTDNVWPQAGYVGKKKELVRMGVELWEYTGPESLHSKSAVIDGKTIIIGSYNLDPRSEKLNTEIAVVVEDESLASTLRATMDNNLQNAWRIGRNGKPEGYDERYPGVGCWKKMKVRMVRLILPFIRGQL
jgi:phosphatidylserine/phosphatidylglycerophosphate/cardiolipin synthase-like enzyme